MEGAKKAILWLLGVLLLIVLAAVLFIGNKEKESKALSEFIPNADYVARVNTKEALKLAYSLKNISFDIDKGSKWAALFSDSLKTGIDYLVNPWFYGDVSNHNLVFKLRSVENYKAWISGVADTIIAIPSISAKAYYVKENALTFISNGEDVALASIGELSLAIENGKQFFSDKQKGANELGLGKELIRIKLNEPLVFSKFFLVEDSLVTLSIKDSFILANDATDLDYDGVAGWSLQMDQVKWQDLMENHYAQMVLKILDIDDLDWEDAVANISFMLKDTFRQTITTVSYEFDDNFNKVEKRKSIVKVHPDLKCILSFKKEEGLKSFVAKNNLSKYKNEVYQMYTKGNQIVFSPSSSYAKLDFSTDEYGFVNMPALEKVMVLCDKPLNLLEQFKGLDELYYKNDPNKGFAFKLKTSIHPLVWLLEQYQEKIK